MESDLAHCLPEWLEPGFQCLVPGKNVPTKSYCLGGSPKRAPDIVSLCYSIALRPGPTRAAIFTEPGFGYASPAEENQPGLPEMWFPED